MRDDRRYKLHQVIPGTFVYKDEETEGRFICPVCYEDEGKEISMQHHPEGELTLEQYVCSKQKCGFIATVPEA